MDNSSNKKQVKMPPVAREIDLVRLGKALWKRFWIIAVAAVLGAMIMLLITTLFIAPKYSSSVQFYVNNKLDIGSTSISISSSDLSASTSLVDTYIVILESREVLKRVIDDGELDYTPEQLRSMMSAESVGDTPVFEVTVTHTDPEEATKIADQIAYTFSDALDDYIITAESTKVIQYAVFPTAPSSPNKTLNTMLGFLAGLVISVGVIVLVEIFDNTIRTEEDITESCDHPILAAVPDMMAATKSKGGYYSKSFVNSRGGVVLGDGISFSATEAYKLLRTKIQFSFADDKKCHVIGVSSALLGEGKSITSTNLAFSLAQLGKKILLIDGDMRRPSLANKLKIKKVPGLSNYLADKTPLDSIIQNSGKKFSDFEFDVIAAGHNPPNPVELLASSKMTDMLDTLKERYDYIIIDLTPVEEVSDALVAAKFVDGMVLVVSQNYCNRHSFINSVNQFDFVDSRILGIVVNRVVEPGRKYYGKYGYKKGYYRGYYGYSKSTAALPPKNGNSAVNNADKK